VLNRVKDKKDPKKEIEIGEFFSGFETEDM
jgi:hypothetical protein